MVGVGVTVGVAVGVDSGSCTPSNAPMSQCGPGGRVKPRWSRLLTGAAAQMASAAASSAARADVEIRSRPQIAGEVLTYA